LKISVDKVCPGCIIEPIKTATNLTKARNNMNTKQLAQLKAAYNGIGPVTSMKTITKAYDMLGRYQLEYVATIAVSDIDFLSDVATELLNEWREDGVIS